MKNLDCNSQNIVYAIMCKKDTCKQVYLGETKQTLMSCLAEHCGYSLADLSKTVI